MTTIMGWNDNIERKGGGANSSRLATAPSTSDTNVRTLTDVLSEIHVLLEEYAPAWYSEELHEKIESALHLARTR